MVEFHQSILQISNSFLRTQERVMLAYLNRNLETTCLEVRAAVPPVQLVEQQGNDQIIALAESPDVVSTAASECESIPKEMDHLNEISTECKTEVMFSDHEALVTAFIELVSQRTGYPPELLDPELDLESDLGIDSIKRVEILSNFRRLLPETMRFDFEGGIEELANLRTLRSIFQWIRKLPMRC